MIERECVSTTRGGIDVVLFEVNGKSPLHREEPA
jgi:hypothetical protein